MQLLSDESSLVQPAAPAETSPAAEQGRIDR